MLLLLLLLLFLFLLLLQRFFLCPWKLDLSFFTQPVWKKKVDICLVRTLLCDKWRYRPPEAYLHVRCTNLLSVTLWQGFTNDSTSPSIRQKSSESWKVFEGACPGFTRLMVYSLLFQFYFGIQCWCEDLNLDLSGRFFTYLF